MAFVKCPFSPLLFLPPWGKPPSTQKECRERDSGGRRVQPQQERKQLPASGFSVRPGVLERCCAPALRPAAGMNYHTSCGLRQQLSSLSVLEARSSKPRCEQALLPPAAWGRVLPGLSSF